MGISAGTALLVGGIGSSAGGVASGLIGANAAENAAGTQSQAGLEAAELQAELGRESLGFQEQQYANTLGLEEPGYLSGQSSLATLDQLLGLPPQQVDQAVFTNPFNNAGSPNGGVTPSIPGLPGVPGPTGITPSPSPITNPTGAPPVASIKASQPAGLSTLGNGAAPLSSLLQLPNAPQGGPAPFQGATGIPGLSPNDGGFPLPNAPQGGPAPFEGGTGSGSAGPPISPGTFNVGRQLFPGSPGGPGGSSATVTPAPDSPATPSGDVQGTGLPAGFLAQTFNQQFQAPTLQQAEQFPGYQFQLQQGEQALQNSAAAQGDLLTGGTAKALDQFSQGLAQTDYNNVFNQALTQYQQAYNVFNQNQSNIFNRYADLAGLGQTNTQQLANAGLATGSNVGNTLLTSGAQIGGDLQNAAAATASGYIGAANAFGGALGSLGNLGSTLSLYSLLGNAGGAGV